ncbi:MAG: dihydropteroate synthase [Pseudomonadota bacterium]
MYEAPKHSYEPLSARLHGDDRPLIMGVLNVTPDSFSDGGRFLSIERAVQQAEQMFAMGADVIDVGGESTRPGAAAVAVQEELDRVVPVIAALAEKRLGVISVDTSKPEVMMAAVDSGAAMINDVWALRRPDALKTAAALKVPVCLMHMQGDPESMQRSPQYANAVDEVCAFLAERADACLEAGIAPSEIVIDPGFGFGKTLAHNLGLLNGLDRIAALGFPVLAGLSRKSMIGELTGKPVDQRLIGSVLLAALAVNNGARIVRVHDVAETREALTILQAVNTLQPQQ